MKNTIFFDFLKIDVALLINFKDVQNHDFFNLFQKLL